MSLGIVDPDEAALAQAYIMERIEIDGLSGCWVWQKATTSRGYGVLRWRGQQWRAHRFAFHYLVDYLHKADPVHHRCSNSSCVRPDHLQRTSHQENTAEMMGRQYMLDEIEGLRIELSEAREALADLREILEAGKGDDYGC